MKLRELDRVRELVLQIPIRSENFLPTQTVLDALWNLRYTVSFVRGIAESRREGEIKT